MATRSRLAIAVIVIAVVTGALYQVFWRAPVLSVIGFRSWETIGAAVIAAIAVCLFHLVRSRIAVAVGVGLGLAGANTWLVWTLPTDVPEGLVRSFVMSLVDWRFVGLPLLIACGVLLIGYFFESPGSQARQIRG